MNLTTATVNLTTATWCCLAMGALVVVLCLIIVYLIEHPRRGCPSCKGCDKRRGSGFCSICGDRWNL